MKKSILAAAALAAFAGASAQDNGNDPAPAATPSSTSSFNVAATSDDRYRGISQTRLEPALQGGADYTGTTTGLYAGIWLSTIKWTRDAGGGGAAEMDLYAGRRGQLTPALAYDVGVLAYVYPANGLRRVAGFANADTAELYGQLAFGPAYVKYSHALTNLFGFVDSRNSGYLDLGANIGMGAGTLVNLHVGRQDIRHHAVASYTDWKIGLTRDFGIVTGAVAFVGTNANDSAYASPANGKYLGRSGWQLAVSRVF